MIGQPEPKMTLADFAEMYSIKIPSGKMVYTGEGKLKMDRCSLALSDLYVDIARRFGGPSYTEAQLRGYYAISMMGKCSECGHEDYVENFEKEVEEDGFSGFPYEVHLCPKCEDGGCIDDYYPKWPDNLLPLNYD